MTPNVGRVNVEVNGVPVSVRNNSTVLQACEAVGIEVPRFCYHERLLVAGNCRMCLVEIAGSPKPQASCALPVMPNMKVFTDSPRVRKARESVMEFLLLNHPLDCPICDQGGECDRQDQAMVFGTDRSRGFENKRGVEDKDIGPLVKTVMTRCIHCTRCIRFASEVAGVADLGTSGRGRDTEVGTYVSKPRKTELSGNLVDLCPVGALTSKPLAFVARPWELESIDTVDTMDAIGSSVKVQVRANEVLRVLPRENDERNQAWLGDKSRYATDGAKIQRIDHGYVKVNSRQGSQAMTEDAVMRTVAGMRTPNRRVQMVLGSGLDVETISDAVQLSSVLTNKVAKVDLQFMKQELPSLESNRVVDSESVMSMGIRSIAKADRCRLVGRDPRREAPILNVWLREAFLRDNIKVRSMGNAMDLTYPVQHSSRTAGNVEAILAGTHGFSAMLAQARRPLVLVGPSVREREDGAALISGRKRLCQLLMTDGSVESGWTIFQTFHTSPASVAAMSLGRSAYRPRGADEAKGTVLMRIGVGAGDFAELGLPMPRVSDYDMRVAMNSHGDSLVGLADVVIPMAVSWEKDGHYNNTEGRVRRSFQAVSSPFAGYHRPLHQLSARMGDRGGVNLHGWLKAPVVAMGGDSAVISRTASGLSGSWVSPTRPNVHDYYVEGHVLARHSRTMAKASAVLVERRTFGSE